MKIDTWHCAGWSCELTTNPIGRTLFGRPVVLFRDQHGRARAVGARCPHRGADLARGSVVDGCIQCPFHGWRFDALGRCTRVPSQPDHVKISPLARLPSFPLHERDGTLWIWMGTGETNGNEPPRHPIAPPGRSPRRLFFDAELVAGPFLTVLENAFDKAHLPFIHRGTFGTDQDPLVARQRITVDPDGRGLRVEDDAGSAWRTEPKLPKGWIGWLARLLLGLKQPTAQHMRFDVGGRLQIYLEYPNGTSDLFLTHITPADAQHTWLFVESARTRAPHRVGDWIQRRAIRRLFDEGQRETSLILAVSPDDPAPPVSVESDRAGLAARRLYERWAQDSAPSARDGDLAAPACIGVAND